MDTKIGNWDIASRVGLIAVAIIETINETLKLEPNISATLPRFLTSSLWHFAPLGLIILVGLIWLAKQIGLFGFTISETQTLPQVIPTSLRL